MAAPLAAGLIWLLRGDVAAATPALARAVGRKVFPSVLSVVDDPNHPTGTRRVSMDDEGLSTDTLSLVDAGVLRGFLHASDTASRLGAPLNGRGFRTTLSPPTPEAVNPSLVPGEIAVLPAHYTELVARVETFTTMPRPGTVTVVAGGWEVRDGRRVRRIAPVELELPVLETFRALRGVGTDLTFFPTAEGCGTPTLVFPPLLSGVQGGQAAVMPTSLGVARGQPGDARPPALRAGRARPPNPVHAARTTLGRRYEAPGPREAASREDTDVGSVAGGEDAGRGAGVGKAIAECALQRHGGGREPQAGAPVACARGDRGESAAGPAEELRVAGVVLAGERL
ncbi:metallopeptidase TldD-related protein [Myxococcus sp. MxC21-1]|nr:metallopeptidase TldD-related protein [Myxococcus sp. MxC21-1]